MNQIVLRHSLGLETALALHIGGIFKYSLKDISNLKLALSKNFCDPLCLKNKTSFWTLLRMYHGEQPLVKQTP